MILSKDEIKKRISESYELPNHVKQSIPEPVVSVCVATCQHVNFIEPCVEGVLMQQATFRWELLIGEDCSTDGTRKKVFEYARKYPDKIRVITADHHAGKKANKQRLLLAARGKYIAPLDGDDYWTDPEKLQKQVDFLEENPDYYMCYHSYKTMKDNKISRIILPKRGRDYTADELIATPAGIAVATKLIRNIYASPVNDDIIEFYNDYDMNMIMGAFGACKFLPGIRPSIRRVHPGGEFTSRSDKNKTFTIINLKTHVYKYFFGKGDEHRTMIAIRALHDALQNNRNQIYPGYKRFKLGRSRIHIVYGGMWFEVHYRRFLSSIKRRIKQVF